MTHPLVDQLRFTRAEWRRALHDMPEADGLRRLEPMNSIGWIVAHLGWQEQQYLIVRAQGRTPIPELQDVAPYGGPPTTPPLGRMLGLWERATAEADVFLDTLAGPDDLSRPLPPPGGERTVGDAILRVTYHYWHHIGEIMAIRQLLGHQRLAEFVGDIEALAPYRPEA